MATPIDRRSSAAAVSMHNCTTCSSDNNHDFNTPASSSSGSFGNSGGGGGGGGGGSALYARPVFPPNSSGGASVPAAASSTFSLRMGGPGSSANAYAHAAPRPPPPPFSPSQSQSPSPSPVYPGPSGGGAASMRAHAPPSPSKLSRPFSFRWGSSVPALSFGSGRGAPGPWAHCTQLLLPQARRSVARWIRSGKRAGMARVAGTLLGLVGCICVFAMLLQLQPQRSTDLALQPAGGGVGAGGLLPAEVDGTLAGATPVPDGVGPRGEDAGRKGAQGGGIGGGGGDRVEEGGEPYEAEDDPDADADAAAAAAEALDATVSSLNPLHIPALAPCAPADLACRVEHVPYHPGAGSAPRRRRVLLVVVNAGFAEMALNLVCSADMVGEGSGSDDGSGSGDSAPWSRGEVPRAAWLVACADEESYEFFLARGIAAVRMNATSALTPAHSPSSPDADADAADSGAAGKVDPAISVGGQASSWGSATHINLNREKVPLVQALLALDVEVVLVDADLVLLHGLRGVFDAPGEDRADLAVMFDHPYAVSLPPFGPGMADCLPGAHRNHSEVCRSAWEMNGGFFLLRPSRRTRALLGEMIRWMRENPREHDQDALRHALRARAAKGLLAWSLQDGSTYPPSSTAATAASAPGEVEAEAEAEGEVLTYRFIPPLLAANGGLFLLDARQAYLDASARGGVLEPHAVHFNWLVGYERKRALMRQYGMWFVARTRVPVGAGGRGRSGAAAREAQCAHAVLSSRKDNLQHLEEMLLRSSTDGAGGGGGGGGGSPSSDSSPASAPLTLAQVAALRAVALAAPRPQFVRPPLGPSLHIQSRGDLARLGRLRLAPGRRGPLVVLGAAPKPLRSYTALPPRRAADADGLGAYDPNAPEHQYAPENVAAYLAAQRTQLHGLGQALRNWFALSSLGDGDGGGGGGDATGGDTAGGGVALAIFSKDAPLGRAARHMRMDAVSHFEEDPHAMPMLRGLFRTLEALALARGASLAMYTNADVLYHRHGLARTLAAVESYGFGEWMGAGIRSNVPAAAIENVESQVCRQEREAIVRDLLAAAEGGEAETGTDSSAGDGDSDTPAPAPAPPPPRISLSHASSYFARLSGLSHPYRSDALDYFVWSPGFFEWDAVPHFALGRIAFDNWLLHYGNTKARAAAAGLAGGGGTVVVDLSLTVRALHLNHGSVALEPVPLPAAAETPAAAGSEGSKASSSDPLSDISRAAMASAGSGGSAILSHFQPGSLTNLKLAGQASLRGLGALQHATWRTEFLPTSGSSEGDEPGQGEGEIRVVKVRPESGHIASLWDAARTAHVRVHNRPALVLVTVDEAHVAHLANWVWHFRRALRNDGPRSRSHTRTRTRTTQQQQQQKQKQKRGAPSPGRSGILVLSAGPAATTAARALGLEVFELSPGGGASSSGLNGPASANLNILTLRSRATLLLLEYGYDLLVLPLSGVWRRNPWRVLARRGLVRSAQEWRGGRRLHKERSKRSGSGANAAAAAAARIAGSFDTVPGHSPATAGRPGAQVPPSFNPLTPEGLPLGQGADLIALAYDSSPFNVSAGAALYRHTPATLRLWRRLLHAHQALLARASLSPPQVNWHNLQADWFLQHELWSGAQADSSAAGAELVWGRVTLDGGVFSMDARTRAVALRSPPSGTLGGLGPVSPLLGLAHLPAGPIIDRDVTLANGWFHEQPGGLGAQWAGPNMLRLRQAGAWEERSQVPRGGVPLSKAGAAPAPAAAAAAGGNNGGGSEGAGEEEDEEEDPCATGEFHCGSLSSFEVDLLLSACTPDQSLALIPVPVPASAATGAAAAGAAAGAKPAALNEFLDRAREVAFAPVVLLADSREQLQAQLSPENAAHGFAALFGPGSGSDSGSDSSGGGSGGVAAPSIFAVRLWQLLRAGFHVGLFNPLTAVVFANPFDYLTNREHEWRVAEAEAEAEGGSGALEAEEQDGEDGGEGEREGGGAAAARRRAQRRRAFDASHGLWTPSLPSASPTLLRPLSEAQCDLHAPGLSGARPDVSPLAAGVELGRTDTDWTFLSVQPTVLGAAWAAQLVACTAEGGPGSESDSNGDQGGPARRTGLPLGCMALLAVAMQSRGGLVLCPLDPHLFPPAGASFEPPALDPVGAPAPLVSQALPNHGRGSSAWAHVSESGVWPIVAARAHENPRTGRLAQWDPAWRQRLAAQQSSNADAPPPRPEPPLLRGDPPGAAEGHKPVRCAPRKPAQRGWFSSAAPTPDGEPDTSPSFMMTIRVLTYTRAASLARLLASLVAADYLGDGGGPSGAGAVRLEVWVDRPAEESEQQHARTALPRETAAAREKRQRDEIAAAASRVRARPSPSPSPSPSPNQSAQPGTTLTPASRRDDVLSVLHSFQWPHGPLSVVLHRRHAGLVGQWLGGDDAADDGVASTRPRSDRDMVLVLEDDLELSPLFYSWLRGAICAYYLAPAASPTTGAPAPATAPGAGTAGVGFDPRLFGISLQRQHYVLGQSVKNAQARLHRFREARHWAERDAAAAAAASGAKGLKGAAGQAHAEPDPIDPSTLLDVQGAAGDPLAVPAFRYQLLGTWGLLVFPSHWAPFRTWARKLIGANEKVIAAAAAATRGGGGVAAPALSAASLPHTPCVPHLESSTWWSSKPDRVWSAWLVRYTWEQGWYALYPHLPGRTAMAVNHREEGENFKAGKAQAQRAGGDTLLLAPPPPPPPQQQGDATPAGSVSPSSASGGRFRYPPLSSLPLFDFHLARVTLDPVVLQQRNVLFTPAQIKRSCSAKNYKQFD